MALWIGSKLLLRAGKIQEASALLARASQTFPADESWDNHAIDYEYEPLVPADQTKRELGALKLSRGQYVESLDLLLRGRSWTDAAYVAERVLTADELKAYVDQNWPARRAMEQPPLTDPFWGSNEDTNLVVRLRALLARRLTRSGRWKDARAYYSADLQVRLDVYIAAIRAGHDAQRSAADRAASLWEAAKIARNEGMQLLGTELDPDYRIWDGQFGDEPGDQMTERKPSTQMIAPTADERARAAQLAAKVNKRFHYRYIAAEHAWAAAQLMPDESDATAKILCEAGSWLKYRAPDDADRFYKALVKRCGATRLGREADRLRWFPNAPEPGGLSPRSTAVMLRHP